MIERIAKKGRKMSKYGLGKKKRKKENVVTFKSQACLLFLLFLHANCSKKKEHCTMRMIFLSKLENWNKSSTFPLSALTLAMNILGI